MDPNEIVPPPVSPTDRTSSVPAAPVVAPVAAAAPAAAPALKSGMYWRKSKLFGWLCPTGILTLESGRLRFVTEKETVFDSPASAVSASFSGWGTLTITVDGKSYDFIGSGGGMAGSFSAAQKSEIAAAAGRFTSGSLAAGAVATSAGAGVIASSVGVRSIDVIGSLVGDSIGAGVYASGVNILKKWPAVLEAEGATVKAKKGNYMWWFFGALAAGLVIAVVIFTIVS
jgi:hypothetical protein